MKKFLPILSIAFITACNNKPDTSMIAGATGYTQQIPATNTDTAGLAQFQAWKIQNELADVSDYNKSEDASVPPERKQKSAVKKQAAPARKRAAAPVASRQTPTTPQSTSGTSVENSGDGVSTGTGSGEVAQAPQKKGISKAAKGAVIGGAGGAIAGAVINKNNRVVGAVIGGVVGAGGGYVIGRKMDKKDGRL